MVKEGLNRPLIYEIFQYLLDKNDELNDEVVRVTAGRQYKNVVEPFEFTAEPFMPFASTILGRLMSLIEEDYLPPSPSLEPGRRRIPDKAINSWSPFLLGQRHESGVGQISLFDSATHSQLYRTKL